MGQLSIETDAKGSSEEVYLANYPTFTTAPEIPYAFASLKLNDSPTEKLRFLSMMMFLVGDGVSRFHT